MNRTRTDLTYCRCHSAMIAATLLFLLCPNVSQAGLVVKLLGDNYNTASTGYNDDLAARQTGTLAPLVYYDGSPAGTGIVNNMLQLGGGSHSAIAPDHDFASTAVSQGGGFEVAFDAILSGGVPSLWMSFTIGLTQPALNAANTILDTSGDLGFIFDNVGNASMWKHGSQIGGAQVYDASPTANEIYRIALFVDTTSIASGSPATATLKFDGSTLFTTSFNWDAEAANYIAFQSFSASTTRYVDNLAITALPEPSAALVLGALGVGVLRRRRA